MIDPRALDQSRPVLLWCSKSSLLRNKRASGASRNKRKTCNFSRRLHCHLDHCVSYRNVFSDYSHRCQLIRSDVEQCKRRQQNTSGKCPLLAHSGHERVHCTCPLLGVSGHGGGLADSEIFAYPSKDRRPDVMQAMHVHTLLAIRRNGAAGCLRSRWRGSGFFRPAGHPRLGSKSNLQRAAPSDWRGAPIGFPCAATCRHRNRDRGRDRDARSNFAFL